MIRLPKLTPRQILIVLHDLVATAAAIVLTFYVRFEGQPLDDRLSGLKYLPVFLIYAAAVYLLFGLHRNKWRFTSVPDLYEIFRAVTVLAVSLLALDYVLVAPNVLRPFLLRQDHHPAVLVAADVLPRRHAHRLPLFPLRAHAAARQDCRRDADFGARARGRRRSPVARDRKRRGEENLAGRRLVAVHRPTAASRSAASRCWATSTISNAWSPISSSRGTKVTRVVLTPSALSPEARPEVLLIRARKLGLTMSQLPSLDAGGQAVQLAPVAVEDLLLRPSVKIDYSRLEAFVSGKAIVVTGGGGSIGSEICDRMVTFGAARLLVIENSEPALHAVLEALKAKQTDGGPVRPHRRYSRPRAHHGADRAVQARHGVSRRRAQARAAARTRLGRGHQDQRIRLDQRRGCSGRGRRRGHGHDFHRQGDRAGFGAGRHQAAGGNVLRGAR